MTVQETGGRDDAGRRGHGPARRRRRATRDIPAHVAAHGAATGHRRGPGRRAASARGAQGGLRRDPGTDPHRDARRRAARSPRSRRGPGGTPRPVRPTGPRHDAVRRTRRHGEHGPAGGTGAARVAAPGQDPARRRSCLARGDAAHADVAARRAAVRGASTGPRQGDGVPHGGGPRPGRRRSLRRPGDPARRGHPPARRPGPGTRQRARPRRGRGASGARRGRAPRLDPPCPRRHGLGNGAPASHSGCPGVRGAAPRGRGCPTRGFRGAVDRSAHGRHAGRARDGSTGGDGRPGGGEPRGVRRRAAGRGHRARGRPGRRGDGARRRPGGGGPSPGGGRPRPRRGLAPDGLCVRRRRPRGDDQQAAVLRRRPRRPPPGPGPGHLSHALVRRTGPAPRPRPTRRGGRRHRAVERPRAVRRVQPGQGGAGLACGRRDRPEDRPARRGHHDTDRPPVPVGRTAPAPDRRTRGRARRDDPAAAPTPDRPTAAAPCGPVCCRATAPPGRSAR